MSWFSMFEYVLSPAELLSMARVDACSVARPNWPTAASMCLYAWARAAATEKSGGYDKVGKGEKQKDAAVGQFGLATLQASTRAIESNSAGDSTYSNIENQLISLTNERNALAAQMITALEGAEFGGQSISEQQAQSLVAQGQALIAEANALGS